MAEAAEQPAAAKPRRTWLPMALWTAAILAALGLTWFVGAVVVPFWRTRAALHEFVNSPASNWRMRTRSLRLDWWEDARKEAAGKAVIEELGGPKRAPRRLGLYASLSDRLAPEKEAAVFLIACCGEEAIPTLADLAARRETRGLALLGLAHLGPGAQPPLTRALDSPDPAVRLLAISAIPFRADGPGETLRLLVRALGDPSWEVREIAAEHLATFLDEHDGERIEPLLVEAMASDDADRRAVAAKAVACYFSSRLVKPDRTPRAARFCAALETMLTDRDPRARGYAAAALLDLGHEEEAAGAEIVRQLGSGPTEVAGKMTAHPYDGGRLYCRLESDDLRFETANALIRARKKPGLRALPGFDASLGNAQAIARSANLKWKMNMTVGDEPDN